MDDENEAKKEPRISVVITLTVIALLCVAVTGAIALRDMFH